VVWAVDHPREASLAAYEPAGVASRGSGDPVRRDLATLVRNAVVEGVAPDQDPELVAIALDGALTALARAAAGGPATRTEILAAAETLAARAIG
jgi:hypothetical protein